MPHDAEPVAPEDVPFDLPIKVSPIKASPLEIECACMIAHGATTAEIATRFGIKDHVIARLRRKPNVKRLIDEYAKNPGSAGYDVLNVSFVHATRKAVALVDNGDPRVALEAIRIITKLVLDMQKAPASQVQVNLMQGVTVKAQAMNKPDDAEFVAEAELAVRVAERFLERKKDEEEA